MKIFKIVVASLAIATFLAPTMSHASCGHASWYGPGFHGHKTASGQKFNQNALTAAHRSIKFGNKVKVTNKTNGRSVIVTVNDRGPFVKGRMIDLSRAAARSIGISGVGKVCLSAVIS